MEKLAILISSCEKFSDLWDTHIELYRKNWPDNIYQTYLVTDKPTTRNYDGVQIIVAEEGLDFPMRIRYALEQIEARYVLLTLDDYFLIKPVDKNNISWFISHMQQENIDYLRLYSRRWTKKRYIRPLDEVIPIDLNKKYWINLYPAIWSANFLKKTVHENVSPWLYEASLTDTAIQENAKCGYSLAQTFEILDVVRKGKLLHKAERFLIQNKIEVPQRTRISYLTETKLWVMDRIRWHAPKPIFRYLKSIAKKCGMTFYSED